MKFWVVLAILAAGCAKVAATSDAVVVADAPAVDAASDVTPTAADAVTATAAFGQTCKTTADCGTSGMTCFLYGDGTSHCTVACKTADDCPSGSAGKQCNGKGFCKP